MFPSSLGSVTGGVVDHFPKSCEPPEYHLRSIKRLKRRRLPEGRDAAGQRLFERSILGAAQRQVHEKLRSTTPAWLCVCFVNIFYYYMLILFLRFLSFFWFLVYGLGEVGLSVLCFCLYFIIIICLFFAFFAFFGVFGLWSRGGGVERRFFFQV